MDGTFNVRMLVFPIRLSWIVVELRMANFLERPIE